MSEPTGKDGTTLPTAQDLVNALTAQREGAHNALAQASALIAAQQRHIAVLQERIEAYTKSRLDETSASAAVDAGAAS